MLIPNSNAYLQLLSSVTITVTYVAKLFTLSPQVPLVRSVRCVRQTRG